MTLTAYNIICCFCPIQWLMNHPIVLGFLVQALEEILTNRATIYQMRPFSAIPHCINCFRRWVHDRVLKKQEEERENGHEVTCEDLKAYFEGPGRFQPCLGFCQQHNGVEPVLGKNLVRNAPEQGWSVPKDKTKPAFKGITFSILEAK